MHALLYREWKGRVKGRDWYDLIWYLRNKIPLSLKYLESCMKQARTLKRHEHLDRNRVLNMLQARIQLIDWESAKQDMLPFISDHTRLDIWSSEFFSEISNQLYVEE